MKPTLYICPQWRTVVLVNVGDPSHLHCRWPPAVPNSQSEFGCEEHRGIFEVGFICSGRATSSSSGRKSLTKCRLQPENAIHWVIVGDSASPRANARLIDIKTDLSMQWILHRYVNIVSFHVCVIFLEQMIVRWFYWCCEIFRRFIKFEWICSM